MFLRTTRSVAWLTLAPLVLAKVATAAPGPALDDSGLDLTQRQPWESCMYCHGAAGDIDDPGVPAIAGQSAAYLRKQLRDYRAGRRVDPERLMTSATDLLDAEDDAVVAAFFAGRATPGKDLAPQPSDATPGARLYWRGKPGMVACVACHPPRAWSAPFDYPYLQGLHPAYLEAQLRAYRGGRRTNDAWGVMRGIAAALSDAELRALATYLGGTLNVME